MNWLTGTISILLHGIIRRRERRQFDVGKARRALSRLNGCVCVERERRVRDVGIVSQALDELEDAK